MAYVDSRSNPHRVPAALAVAVLQAAGIYAIVTGLTVSGVFQPEPLPLPTRNIEVKSPPPEPAETQAAQQIDRPIVAPLPPIDLPRLPHPVEVLDIPIAIPPTVPKIPARPPAQAQPAFSPAGPVPKTDPGGWVSTNDYPTRDIRAGNEGLARFVLAIDARGSVQDCRITASSGHAGLDDATCRYVSRRARFEPATDSAGARVGGTYQGTIRWVIPRD